MKILCYSKCSTCRKAEKWLKEKGLSYSYRPIKEENPSEAELTEWTAKSGLPIAKFFNTSGLLYKEQNLKDKVKVLPESELIKILATDGMLVKRPILLADNGKVLVGFNEEVWTKELFA